MEKGIERPVNLSMLREVVAAPEHRGTEALRELRRAPLKGWKGLPQKRIEEREKNSHLATADSEKAFLGELARSADEDNPKVPRAWHKYERLVKSMSLDERALVLFFPIGKPYSEMIEVLDYLPKTRRQAVIREAIRKGLVVPEYHFQPWRETRAKDDPVILHGLGQIARNLIEKDEQRYGMPVTAHFLVGTLFASDNIDFWEVVAKEVLKPSRLRKLSESINRWKLTPEFETALRDGSFVRMIKKGTLQRGLEEAYVERPDDLQTLINNITTLEAQPA